MNLKVRIRRLEERRGLHRTTPPFTFFDRLLTHAVTQEEWRRWLPWINAHLAKTAGSEIADHALRSRSELH